MKINKNMKHLKNFIIESDTDTPDDKYKFLINERRNLRDFLKYRDILKRKFKNYIRIEKLESYKEDDKYNIEIKTWGAAHKEFFDFLNSDIKTYDYYISPSNGNQLTISISDIPEQYFEQLDLELDVNKYNL